MAALRAFAYFVQEALTSLWRSRLITALAVGSSAISLFVLGAFLTVAGSLNQVVERWAEKAQVTFYLVDPLPEPARASLETRLKAEGAVESVAYVSRAEALARFGAMFRDLRMLADDLGENPFPASFELTLRTGRQSPEDVRALVAAYERAPGVQEAQYDLLWIQRLATAVRLVRLTGAFLGGVLVMAGLFTISNVIRLTVYARQDELDIMRLVGATPAYVKGPFVVEGMIQGGLGGLLSVGLLWLTFRVGAARVLAGAEIVGPATLAVPRPLCVAIVAGGILVGLTGSLLSLGRSQV